VGPTCQTPCAAPGPPGSALLPRGCHAPRCSSALRTLSGLRVGVPTALPTKPRCPRRHLAVTSPQARVVLTACSPSPKPPPRSEAAPPLSEPCTDAAVAGLHRARRAMPPGAVVISAPPPLTPLPPHRRKTTAGHRSPTSSGERRRRARFLLLTVDKELR
jgi:hypothetical protein